jgi:hypothetical protein
MKPTWVSWLIAFCLASYLGLYTLANWAGGKRCERRGRELKMRTQYGWLDGCRVEVEPGKWREIS